MRKKTPGFRSQQVSTLTWRSYVSFHWCFCSCTCEKTRWFPRYTPLHWFVGGFSVCYLSGIFCQNPWDLVNFFLKFITSNTTGEEPSFRLGDLSLKNQTESAAMGMVADPDLIRYLSVLWYVRLIILHGYEGIKGIQLNEAFASCTSKGLFVWAFVQTTRVWCPVRASWHSFSNWNVDCLRCMLGYMKIM